ncbi:uracil-DNA glycosylase [Luteitalea sp.]|uniref:uracil-DNA glycosylase n=1 Tax=Luteitalea sp. TaxID=2004800 RepID=UPI000A813CB8|nr:uracil-DNA glycosylase [Luteitalea sp.]
MSDDPRAQLRAHLQFYADLGITGFSREAAWTASRGDGRLGEPALPIGESALPDVRGPVAVDPSLVAVGHQVDGHGGDGLLADRSAPMASFDSLDELRTHIGPQCTRCKLCTLGRTQVVFGVGNPSADLMFVGEAPGSDEDVQGIPFVGRAGQLLTKIIEAIEMRREDVYIANVIKCRPPGNRNPEPDEVATCEPFLFRQIDLVKPRVIVALGKFAAQSLLRTDTPITKLRGQVHPFRGAQLVPTFHPAYLLRSPDKKRETWEDMKLVRSLLRGEER